MVLIASSDPFKHDCFDNAISECCDKPSYNGSNLCSECMTEAEFVCSFCGDELV